jgi:5-methylcytosine-specific restriction enzyme A
MRTIKNPRGSRDWYQKQVWRNRAKHQLKIEPLCATCLRRGTSTPAVLADHEPPHNDDWNAFRLGPLQSLCHDCHNRKHHGNRDYARDIGPDGWPLDPHHPVYGGKTSTPR